MHTVDVFSMERVEMARDTLVLLAGEAAVRLCMHRGHDEPAK